LAVSTQDFGIQLSYQYLRIRMPGAECRVLDANR
jgi:hypothetical protein